MRAPTLRAPRPNRALAAALAAALALAVGGCGDGDDETSSVTTSEQAPPQATAPDDSGLAGGAGNGGDEDGDGDRDSSAPADGQGSSAGGQSDSSPPPVSGAPVEGSKEAAPGVPTSKHGDDSIQTYGVEAGSDERAEATAVVQEFLDARAARNWEQACSLLAAKPLTEYENLLKDSTKKGIPACAEAMRVFATGVPDSAFAEEAEISEVLSLRTDDEYAFLIYTRPDGKVYATAISREGGSWKIISVGPTEIVA